MAVNDVRISQANSRIETGVIGLNKGFKRWAEVANETFPSLIAAGRKADGARREGECRSPVGGVEQIGGVSRSGPEKLDQIDRKLLAGRKHPEKIGRG